MNRTRQKISKNPKDLNNTINQLDLNDILNTLPKMTYFFQLYPDI